MRNKLIEKLAEAMAFFLINLIIFLLAKIFTDIGWAECFVYSIVNSAWMTFLIPPLLKRFKIQEEDDFKLNPLVDYIKDFQKRQIEVKREAKEQEKLDKELERKFKREWKLFNVYIKKNKITNLYHFTDKENLKSILKYGGLFSWDYCLKNQIGIPKPGGGLLSRRLDKKYSLQNYVRLSFTPNHPMMYAAIKDGRISSPVVLEINPEVIYWHKTMYSDKNATTNEKEIGESFDYFNNVRFEIMKEDYRQIKNEERPYFQAEVLVFEKLPLTYIRNIYEYQE